MHTSLVKKNVCDTQSSEELSLEPISPWGSLSDRFALFAHASFLLATLFVFYYGDPILMLSSMILAGSIYHLWFVRSWAHDRYNRSYFFGLLLQPLLAIYIAHQCIGVFAAVRDWNAGRVRVYPPDRYCYRGWIDRETGAKEGFLSWCGNAQALPQEARSYTFTIRTLVSQLGKVPGGYNGPYPLISEASSALIRDGRPLKGIAGVENWLSKKLPDPDKHFPSQFRYLLESQDYPLRATVYSDSLLLIASRGRPVLQTFGRPDLDPNDCVRLDLIEISTGVHIRRFLLPRDSELGRVVSPPKFGDKHDS